MCRFARHTLFTLLALCPVGALQAQTVHDPLRPPGKDAHTEGSAPSWTLHSTLIAEGRRSAVINGRVVTEGARIDGAVVIEIRPSVVRLRSKTGDVLIRESLVPIKRVR